MRYLALLLGTAFVLAALTIAAGLALAPAPIKAEYWVRESMVIKRHLADRYRGRPRLLLVGGSSVLFGLDAKRMSEALDAPVINLGMHAGLPLDVLLGEAERISTPGDIVILALEPPYFRSLETTTWRARNAIAWDRDRWRALTLGRKIEAITILLPGIVKELAETRWAMRHPDRTLREREQSLDDSAVIEKFTHGPRSPVFAYSAYNLDDYGDMQHNDLAKLTVPTRFSPEVTERGQDSLARLRTFAAAMKARGVALYFFASPYVETPGLRADRIEQADRDFAALVAPLGEVLGQRSQAVFPREMFFDSDLHLNNRGREIRTDRLIALIRARSGLLARLQGK